LVALESASAFDFVLFTRLTIEQVQKIMKTVLMSLGVACGLGIPSIVANAAPAKPNIVLILADDLGYGDLGCYGHPTFKTPHLDRLAAEGARLTQFNTPAPYCAPTRAALLTGRYPWRCGMSGNPHPAEDARVTGINPEHDKIGLPLTEVTLAELLKQSGYTTACIGKWHLGHQLEFLPTRRGFDEYFGIPYSNDMRPVQVLDGERVVEYPAVQTTLTKRYTGRAVQFIERNRSTPFFLYFAQMHPHKPLAPGEAFYRKSGGGLYGDTVAELDWSVGQVLAKLKESQLDTNTLVIFTSDNGPWFGGSTGGLRGMKGSTYEGGYRVPCIARWPGHIPAGHVNESFAITMDLFPTLLKAAGVEPPRNLVLDGRNILPLFASAAESPHQVIFEMSGANLVAVRDQRWKLHVLKPTPGSLRPPGDKWIDPRGPDGVTILAPYEQYHPAAYPGLRTGDTPQPMMLFDLQSDPGEQHDIADQHANIVERLKREYDLMRAAQEANQRAAGRR
jgi:uncharacterized sulfatase